MPEEKIDRLYELLEDASRRVKDWPDWKRSDDSKRELERLAQERQKAKPDQPEP